MNKDQFNQLEIQQQVEYINQGLELESVTKVCSNIGIDRATVRKRFKSNGYELIDNKYIATETTADTTTNKTKETTTTTKATRANKKATEQTQDNKQMKVLENRVGSLEKELESIKAMINTMATSTTENTNTVTTTSTTKIKRFKGADSSRSYRVNNKVLEQWKAFCKAHSEHKVGDLLANAMVEYMNKFN